MIVEAWAVVQRGYVDQQFGGKDWKAIKSAYLKRKYSSMSQVTAQCHSVPNPSPGPIRSHNPYPHDVWITQARSAVSTMLAELGDRYTRYLTPGAYASLLAKYERPADNGGIGVTVRNVAGTGAVEIVSVIEGAPAAAAGLRVGDVFETVNGRPVPFDATADDVAGLLLGRLEEPVSLSVRRAGAPQRVLSLATRTAPHTAPHAAHCPAHRTPHTAPHTALRTAHRTPHHAWACGVQTTPARASRCGGPSSRRARQRRASLRAPTAGASVCSS